MQGMRSAFASRAGSRAGRLLLWLALVSAAGCAEPGPSVPPSVVLCVIDTLRADHLGAYGDERGLTPHLDALARESVVFESASAPAPWTLPSVASILTSTFPCEHATVVDGDRIPDATPTLAELLRDAGYQTASFFESPYAGSMSGLDRGFAQAEQNFDTGRKTAGQRIDELLPGPFFLYVHTTDPHDPYHESHLGPAFAGGHEARQAINGDLQRLRSLTRADWSAKREIGSTDNSADQQRAMQSLRERREDILLLYAKDVAQADERLGTLVAALKERGLFEDTLFILVSDHGEEFDEHGGWQHDHSAYEELLHVPLLVHLPGGRGAGTRVVTPVSGVDLAPTILDVAGVPAPEGLRGRSLLTLASGATRADEAAPIRVTGMRINRKKFSRSVREARGDHNLVARQGPWKSIWNIDTGTIELYRLSDDPSEDHDLAKREPQRARAMQRASERWLASCRPASPQPASGPPIDAESLERLKALGYVD